MNKNIQKKAFSIIEVIVAAAIVLLVGTVFVGVLSQTISLSGRSMHVIQASSLLEEGAEAVKTIRDNDWTTISNLTVGTTYYLSYSSVTNLWSLTTTPSTIGIFTRTVVISAVNRDSNDDIVSSGGTLDVKTKKVTITTSFNSQSGTISKTLVFYISDIFN